jgi:hypothetical protein
MSRIELTEEEQETLSQLLKMTLAALEIEIQHTDHREFKERLQHRRDVLKRVMFKVLEPEPAAVS